MSNELLDLIKKGESGAAGYNAYNRGTHGKMVIPANQRIDFSEMTIEELQRRQNLPKGDPPDFSYDRVFAVGKYQIIPDTLKLAVNHLQLKGDEKFSQETQDRIFSEYLIVSKRKAIHGYITNDPAYSLDSARRALSEEWASFPDPRKPGTQSYYPAPNRAHITHDEVIDALNNMKRQYADRITDGLDKESAWRVVTRGESARADSVQTSTVERIQQNLNALGFTDARGQALGIDGVRGKSTNEAIAAFQRQTGLPSELSGQQTPAGLLAATEVALDARDPMRRLNRHLDDIGQRIDIGAVARPQPVAGQSYTGLPDFLVQTRHADPSETTTPATSTPLQTERAPSAQGREVPATGEAATAALPPLPQSGLQPGDRGRNVAALQQHLHVLGATDRDGRPLQVDGHYGQHTREAVEQFQLWSGRGAKGIADEDTLQALAAHTRLAAQQRVQGIAPGRHLADNLAPSGPAPSDAAELRYPSVVASTVTHHATEFRSFNQPGHPQHALYSQLKSALPEYTSEQRLAQFTAALHVDGIRPGDLKAIDVSAERAQFTTRWGAVTSVDLATDRPPSIEQSLQKVENHSQELQEQAQRAQAERQQQAQAVQH